MKHAPTTALLAAALVAALVLLRPDTSVEERRASHERPRPAAGQLPSLRPAPGAVAVEAAPAEAPWQRTFTARTAQVREDCGLDVRTTCEETGCVAITAAPDLDRFSGWAQLLLRNPRFVASTAARDLGVPPDLLPCGAAIAELTRGPATASVELPDGSEVWCMPTDASGAARWDARQRDLCDRAASALLGPEAAGFGDELRILRFDR